MSHLIIDDPAKLPGYIQGLAAKLGMSYQDAALTVAIDMLRELAILTVQVPKLLGTGPNVAIQMVQVITAGTPVQAVSTIVPRGHQVVVRMRHHATSTGRVGYVGFSQQQVSRDQTRIELKSNDSFSVYVPDMDSLWFDSDTASTKFEIIAEAFEQDAVVPRESSLLSGVSASGSGGGGFHGIMGRHNPG